uniref:Uncharacterized protein n=1 Tax=viral metagenome TaxID=1070528 RepID=A0A2V0RKX0_9ZZZZ
MALLTNAGLPCRDLHALLADIIWDDQLCTISDSLDALRQHIEESVGMTARSGRTLKFNDDVLDDSSCIVRADDGQGRTMAVIYAHEYQISARRLIGWSNLRGGWAHFSLPLYYTSQEPQYCCSDTWKWNKTSCVYTQHQGRLNSLLARKAVSYNPFDYVVHNSTERMGPFEEDDIELEVPDDFDLGKSVLAKLDDVKRQTLRRALGVGHGIAAYDPVTSTRVILPALNGADYARGEGSLLPVVLPECELGQFATFDDSRANAVSVSMGFSEFSHMQAVIWTESNADQPKQGLPQRVSFSGVTSLAPVSHASVFWRACVPGVSNRLRELVNCHNWDSVKMTYLVKYVALIIAHFWRIFIEHSLLPEPNEHSAVHASLKRRGWVEGRWETDLEAPIEFKREFWGNWDLDGEKLFTRLRLMPMRVVKHAFPIDVMETGATVTVNSGDGPVNVRIVARLTMATGMLQLLEQDGSITEFEFNATPYERPGCYAYFLMPVDDYGDEPKLTCPSLRAEVDDDENRKVARPAVKVKADASGAPGVTRMFAYNSTWQSQAPLGWERLTSRPDVGGMILNIKEKYPRDAVLVLSLERVCGKDLQVVMKGIAWQLNLGMSHPKWLHVLTEEHALRALADFCSTPFVTTNELPHIAHLVDEPTYPGFNIAFVRSNWREAARAQCYNECRCQGRWTPFAVTTSRAPAPKRATPPAWLTGLSVPANGWSAVPGANLSAPACAVMDKARECFTPPLRAQRHGFPGRC